MSNGASNKWVGDEYSQLLVEQIAVMVSKEKTCTDYLSGFPKMNTDYLIDEVWRQKAAEWMFKVIDFYVSKHTPFFLSATVMFSHVTIHQLKPDRILIET